MAKVKTVGKIVIVFVYTIGGELVMDDIPVKNIPVFNIQLYLRRGQDKGFGLQ